jgi:polysaccharide pyruvyl transferase WcaK-like protein
MRKRRFAEMSISVLFIGAYGIENAGDDLPMLVMMENLKKTAPDKKFQFYSLTRHKNKWEEKSYKVKQYQNLEYQNREEAKNKWFRGVNFNDSRKEFYSFLKLIESMDVLVIGAGNFIIDISIDIFKGPIPLIWWYIHIAKLYDKKVFLYGISAEKLQTEYAKLLTKEIIKKSDVITLRDKYTKNYLKSLGINKKMVVLPDPTLGIKVKNKKSLGQNNKITVALGLRDLSFLEKKGNKVLNVVIDFINNNPKYHFIFVPQSTYKEDSDIILAKKISKKLNKDIEYNIIKKRLHPYELIQVYAQCDVTLAIRLHSAVFSYIAHTPALAISYLSKVESFMKDFGVEDQVLNIDNVTSKQIDENIQKILIDKIKLTEHIKQQNKIKRQKVKKYAKLLNELLDAN